MLVVCWSLATYAFSPVVAMCLEGCRSCWLFFQFLSIPPSPGTETPETTNTTNTTNIQSPQGFCDQHPDQHPTNTQPGHPPAPARNNKWV